MSINADDRIQHDYCHCGIHMVKLRTYIHVVCSSIHNCKRKGPLRADQLTYKFIRFSTDFCYSKITISTPGSKRIM